MTLNVFTACDSKVKHDSSRPLHPFKLSVVEAQAVNGWLLQDWGLSACLSHILLPGQWVKGMRLPPKKDSKTEGLANLASSFSVLVSLDSVKRCREVHGGLVVSTRCFHCCCLGSVPGLGTEISHQATHCTLRQKKNIYIYIYMYVYIYIHTHLYMYIYIYIQCHKKKSLSSLPFPSRGLWVISFFSPLLPFSLESQTPY